MANAKKFNGKSIESNTYTNEKKVEKVDPLAINLLPDIFKTDINKKLFTATVEDMFQPNVIENVNYNIGRPTAASGQLTSSNNDFLPTADNKKRQLEEGIVVRRNDNKVYTLTSDNLALSQGFLDEHDNEPLVPVSINDFPINPDKFINWSNYMWVAPQVPIIHLTGSIISDTSAPINILNDIIGKQYYTTPLQANGRTLSLKNGMRVSFKKTVDGRESINGTISESHIADGTNQLDFYNEVSGEWGFSKFLKVVVEVDGVVKTFGQNNDFEFVAESIIWNAGSIPPVGSQVELTLTDYYVNADTVLQAGSVNTQRVFQVSGVGTPSGIKLLSQSHQDRQTIYSTELTSLWDQTNLSWDELSWEGDILGINEKHYVTQESGAENRSAFSRTNVWLHKDTINETCNFLNIRQSDIVSDKDVALRPIIEFENSLETFNHGTTFKGRIGAVAENEEGVSQQPDDYVGLDIIRILVDMFLGSAEQARNELIYQALINGDEVAIENFLTQAFSTNQKARTALTDLNLIAVRQRQGIRLFGESILWLRDGSYKNKIIVFRTNSQGICTHFIIDTPKDGQSMYIKAGLKAYFEYKVDGSVVYPAQTRLSRTHVPLWRLYDRNQVPLDKWAEQLGDVPTRQSSTIIEYKDGSGSVDKESGFRLLFDNSNFSVELNNNSKNKPADILFDYTLQDATKFLTSGDRDADVPGPINFRRLHSVVTGLPQSVNDGMSTGVLKAWFRLKSWASLRIDSTDIVNGIEFSKSAWPTYEWVIVPHGDNILVQHADNFKNVVYNMIVGGSNEPLVLKTTALTDVNIYDDSNTLVLSGTADARGIIKVDTALDSGFYTAKFGPNYYSVPLMIIEPKNDPRTLKVKVDGFIVGWTPTVTRDADNFATSVTIILEEHEDNKSVEIMHQGEFVTNAHVKSQHCTAIPGLAYNPTQNISFVNGVTPSILNESFEKNILANSRGNENWSNSFQIPSINGSYTADISAMRGMWATQRLNPDLGEVVINRSMNAWRWHRRFIKLAETFNNAYDVTTSNSREILDLMLDQLNTEVNTNSTDAESGMVFSTTNMLKVNYTVAGSSETTFAVNIGSSTLNQGEYDPDHVYVYVDNILQIEGYSVDTTPNVIFSNPVNVGSVVSIYYRGSATPLLSGVPASPTKLGLKGLTKPELIRERWGMFDRFLILRHDGSKVMAHQDNIFSTPDPRDYLILELEKRIYVSCTELPGATLRENSGLYCNPNITNLRSLAEVRWFESNDIDFRDRSQDFDFTDPWTWNYSGESWRGMYIRLFGTYQPDSRPWEILNFSNKPDWWDHYYQWGDPTQRIALESALRTGLVSEPGQPAVYDYGSRREYPNGFPITTSNKLIPPSEWLGITVSEDAAGAPWEIGSYGVWEDLWARSSAGAYHQIFDKIGNNNTVNEFVEKGINPYVLANKNNTTEALGQYSIFPDVPWVQLRPTVGIGALLFESNKELNFPGSEVINELENLGVVLMFGMGGFSNQEARFKMPHAKVSDGTFVPDEDFNLTLDAGVATNDLRYSAVRLEREDDGFRVYGFDPEQRYFTTVLPIKDGTSGTFQRTVQTDTDTLILYKQHETDVINIPYGHKFETKQELYEFFIGVQALQERNGLVFDKLNSRGTVGNWEQVALDAMTWIGENWGTDTYWLGGPIDSKGFLYEHQLGHLDKLDNDLTRRGKIIFSDGKLAQPNDLLISRNYNEKQDLVEITSKKQVTFIDFSLRSYDHVFFFNNSTRFGDVINNSQLQYRLQNLKMVARRTRGWDGKPFAQGVIVTNTGLLPGLESLATDIVKSRDTEKSQFNTFLSDVSKGDIIPSKKSIIEEIISDETVAFAYKQGLNSASGTNLAINALFRNSSIDIPGTLQDLEINEQWLFTDGEFGKLGNRRVWEIEVRAEDMTSTRQIIRFKEGEDDVDFRSDNIIDILKNDSRWVSRSKDINFKTIARSDITPDYTKKNNWLPSAGVGNLVETNVQKRSVNELFGSNIGLFEDDKFERLDELRSFSKFGIYKEGDRVWNNGLLYQAIENVTGGQNTAFDSAQWTVVTEDAISLPPTVWLSDFNFKDFTTTETGETEVSWNILQGTVPSLINEICPNGDPALEESKVTFANAHGLAVDDMLLILGTNEETIRTFHKVTKVIDAYNILIPTRVSTKTENLVSITMMNTKGKTTADLPTNLTNIAVGTKFYLEPDSTAQGEYTVYEFNGTTWIINEEATTLQGNMVDSTAIDSITLLDGDTGNKIANIELFDPYKGFTIDDVVQYLNYRQGADPAVYNIDEFGNEELDATTYWENTQIGKLWWDTSKLRYAEYEQRNNVEYRANYWGEQFADSEVEIYEWYSSDEEPAIDTHPDARIDYSDGDGVIRYTENQEYNNNGALVTKYYYWSKNPSDIPTGAKRIYSALAIQSALNSPDIAGITWASPIATNALVLSNANGFLASRKSVILRIVERTDGLQQHVNSLLVSEGRSGSIIPEYLFRRLKTSISGRDQYRRTHNLKEWTPNTLYNEGDVVINYSLSQVVTTSTYNDNDIPVVKFLNDTREKVEGVLRPIYQIDEGTGNLVDSLGNIFALSTDPRLETKKKLHRPMLITNKTGYTSTSDFVADALSDWNMVVSGATAVQQAGGLNGEYLAVIPARRRVPDTKLHPLRRYGNQYVPLPQTWYKDIKEARRNFVYSANKYLLQANVVSKATYDAHLLTYQPLFGPYVKDLTPYWEFVDYLGTGYVVGSEQAFVDNLSEITTLSSDITVFGLLDSNGELERSFNKNGLDIELVFQRDGTIQFLDTVWDGSLGDAWDTARWDKFPWDEDGSEVLESLLTALREDLLVTNDIGFFNLFFFDMVKESLNQIPNSSWAIKSTYLDISKTSSDDLRSVSLFYDKLAEQVATYIQEVKPYHTKIANFNNKLSSIDTINVGITESLTMTIETEEFTVTDEDNAVLTDEDGNTINFLNPDVSTSTLVEVDPNGASEVVPTI